MRFTPAEFLAFAKAAQHDHWETVFQAKPFQYAVSNTGIAITPSGGTSRSVANSEVVKFCAVYGTTREDERAVYRKIFNSSYLFAIASKYSPDRTDFRFPEEMHTESLREGATRTVEVNAFERSPEARRRCIDAHGTSCVVCEFSFGRAYGDFARDFIHVHHLNPLAVQRDEHEVDPVRDLRPVCPNCHAVIHMRNGCLSIEEAKAMVRVGTSQVVHPK